MTYIMAPSSARASVGATASRVEPMGVALGASARDVRAGVGFARGDAAHSARGSASDGVVTRVGAARAGRRAACATVCVALAGTWPERSECVIRSYDAGNVE